MSRGVLIGAAAVLVSVPLMMTGNGATEVRLVEGQGDMVTGSGKLPDTLQVRAFLDGVRGANALQCEFGLQTLDLQFGWRRVEVVPDGALEMKELVRWATRRIADPEAVAPLRAALDDEDTCARRVAARLLGRMRTDEAKESLLGALRSSSAQTRELAALGLGFAEDRETARQLIDALGDPNPRIRATLAWALGRIESREAVASLARLLRTDADGSVRRAAAWALGAMY